MLQIHNIEPSMLMTLFDLRGNGNVLALLNSSEIFKFLISF
jgi:hypothetical protein